VDEYDKGERAGFAVRREEGGGGGGGIAHCPGTGRAVGKSKGGHGEAIRDTGGYFEFPEAVWEKAAKKPFFEPCAAQSSGEIIHQPCQAKSRNVHECSLKGRVWRKKAGEFPKNSP
jgi:hypothetical protein